MNDYTFRYSQHGAVVLVEVLLHGVFQRQAIGATREDALVKLRTQLQCAVDEGRRAQAILDELDGETEERQ